MLSKPFLCIKTMRPKDSSFYIFIPTYSILSISILFAIPISIFQSLQIITVMGLFSLYSFCSNNLFDKKIDEINPLKRIKNPYSSGDISKREIVLINAVLLALMFLLTYLWFPGYLLLLFLFVANITLYSRYFKRMPVMDLFTHFIWVFSFFLFPALILGIPAHIILLSTVAFLGISNLAVLEANQFLDLESDSKAGIRSTVLVFGKRISKMVSYASNILIIASIFGFSLIFSTPLPLMFIPLSCLTFFRIRKNSFLGSSYERISLSYIIFLLLFSSLSLALPFL
jgi:4-hydroxybenzoate polyprenyltransferase